MGKFMICTADRMLLGD